MIESLSHITSAISHLERASHFMKTVSDAHEVYSNGEKIFSIAKEKFYLLSGSWFAIMEGGPIAEKTYNHVAFKNSDDALERYEARLRSLGLEIMVGRSRICGEGRSLYFYDDDKHLFELHTGTLNQAPCVLRNVTFQPTSPSKRSLSWPCLIHTS